MSKPYKDFEPKWVKTPAPKNSYRSIFRWGDPEYVKYPKESLYKMMKQIFSMTDEDFSSYDGDIGMDTVKLDGKGFETFVKDGQKVKKGQKLMEFDLEYIRANAASEACMAVFTGLTEGREIHMVKTGEVRALDEIGWY